MRKSFRVLKEKRRVGGTFIQERGRGKKVAGIDDRFDEIKEKRRFLSRPLSWMNGPPAFKLVNRGKGV